MRFGVKNSKWLRYLYLVMPYTDLPIVKQINLSNSLVTIVVQTELQHSIKDDTILKLYEAFLEPRSNGKNSMM